MSEAAEVEVGKASGSVLDYLVALAEGHEPILHAGQYLNPVLVRVVVGGRLIAWRPSRDWGQCGPMLDAWCKGFGLVQDGESKRWRSFAYGSEPFQRLAGGESILVAACRARALVVLGESATVPVELLEVPRG